MSNYDDYEEVADCTVVVRKEGIAPEGYIVLRPKKDLVERLREELAYHKKIDTGAISTRLLREAADRIEELEADENESMEAICRLTDLLNETANILKGEPDSTTMWSFHDIPELVKGQKAMIEQLEAIEKAARNIDLIPAGPGSYTAVYIPSANLKALKDALEEKSD